MMRHFSFPATTASEANTNSGLSSGFGRGSQSQNSRSYLKLILYCFFLPDCCPHTKLHPNWTKNIGVKMICMFLAQYKFPNQILSKLDEKRRRFTVGRLWQVSWVGLHVCSHLKLIICCSLPDVIPISYFIRIGLKKQSSNFRIFLPQFFFGKIHQSDIEYRSYSRSFCMVSLEPELSKIFLLLISIRHPKKSQNGSRTFANKN